MGGGVINLLDPIAERLDKPFQLLMSIKTGDGEEGCEFPVIRFSPFKSRGGDHLWKTDRHYSDDLFVENVDLWLLVQQIKWVGDFHTLTIMKRTDIATPLLVKQFHRKKPLPAVFFQLALARRLDDARLVRLSLDGVAKHNTLFMPDARITHLETHTRYGLLDTVAYVEYVTFKVRDAFLLQ